MGVRARTTVAVAKATIWASETIPASQVRSRVVVVTRSTFAVGVGARSVVGSAPYGKKTEAARVVVVAALVS